MKLIGIAGRMGHGKDTVAGIIRELTPGMTWEIKKYAGKLKQIASILTGIPVEKFEDPSVKNMLLPKQWATIYKDCFGFPGTNFNDPMTVRELLQKLGTDAIRDHLHPNTWVNALFADCMSQNWLITDVRFRNEVQAIKDRGGAVIRVKRDIIPEIGIEHISESALDGWQFDFTIDNSGTLADLKASVAAILRHYRIGQYGDESKALG